MKLAILMQGELANFTRGFRELNSTTVDFSAKTLDEFIVHYTGIPCILDKLLIREDALTTANLSDLLKRLHSMLTSGNVTFKIETVYFLLYKDSKLKSYVDYFFEDLPNCQIYVEPSYTFRSISKIVSHSTTPTSDIVVEEDELIQEKIGVNDITLFTNTTVNKTVLVVDNPQQVANMMAKMDIQRHMLELNGDHFVGTDTVNPRNKELLYEQRPVIQYESTKEKDEKAFSTTIAVTGEKGTGKSVLALNLATSYAKQDPPQKVLLIDGSLHNMGLSALCESVKLQGVTVVYLSDILQPNPAETTKIINQISSLTSNLVVLALDTKLVNQIKTDNLLSGILEILISTLKKSYTKIIIDIPLSKYQQYTYIFNNCDYTLMTYYRNSQSAYSLGKYIRDINVHLQWYKLLFVPTDAYTNLDNLETETISSLKLILRSFLQQPVHTTRCLHFKGIGTSSDLSKAIDLSLSKLPNMRERQATITESLNSKVTVVSNLEDEINSSIAEIDKIIATPDLNVRLLVDSNTISPDNPINNLLLGL